MKLLSKTLLFFLVVVFVGCNSQLTTYKARLALMRWSSDVKYCPPSSSCSSEIDSSSVENNTGDLVVEGIQESPSDNTAKADLKFSNFKYESSGRERSYSGKGVATFSRYNDGTWVLKKVSTSEKEWDNFDFKGN